MVFALLSSAGLQAENSGSGQGFSEKIFKVICEAAKTRNKQGQTCGEKRNIAAVIWPL